MKILMTLIRFDEVKQSDAKNRDDKLHKQVIKKDVICWENR